MSAEKLYEVTWNIKRTRYIKAYSREHAIEISEDMGTAGVEDPPPDCDVSPMRAKLSREMGQVW